MPLLTLFAFVVMYIVASAQELKQANTFRIVDQQYETRRRERELFREKYGANDDLVLEALKAERDCTPIAEEIRKRLLDEAGFNHLANPGYGIRNCHPIALGILAQSAKIPNDFIDSEIDWSRECVERKPGGVFCSPDAARMMERFIRWYDKELTDKGINEHLIQKKSGVRRTDSLFNSDYEEKISDIRDLDHLVFREPIFWPSTRGGVLRTASIRKISGRLIN